MPLLGLDNYGSDSDDGSDAETSQPPSTSANPTSVASKPPAPAKKTVFSLPPPTNASAKPTQPEAKRKKKIAIGLPTLTRKDTEDEGLDDRPPTKKPRLEAGAGASALLSMLPAPKNKNPVKEAPERVLGGGRGPGLVFNSSANRPPRATVVEDVEDEGDDGDRPVDTLDATSSAILEERTEEKPALPFMPTSVARGRANVSTEERHAKPPVRPPVSSAPAVDFFSLGSSSSAGPSRIPSILPAPKVSATPSLPTVSSAPAVDEFVPPEPTPEDPYPGYYLLPTGSWAQYDTAYYQKFYNKWKREYDAHVRAIEKGTAKGFEAYETEGAEEVNALKEMERAKKEIQEREERKALTTAGAAVPAAPKMNIKGAALSGRARGRHQLTSLLTEAYQNREALEEKIAQGRKNRKEAGNKYGF